MSLGYSAPMVKRHFLPGTTMRSSPTSRCRAWNGLALLTEIRMRRPDTPTLIITGHDEHALAIDALRGGAYDFIQKPIDRDDFVGALTRAIQAHALNRRGKDRRSALERCASELERIVEEFGRVPATPTSSEP